jgi:heat-inducible transcriptional repressor
VARHPEFHAAERLRPVLELIDGAEPWGDVVLDATEPGLKVSIGRENPRADLAHLSIVSYRLRGPWEASIGLLGPRRMDHGRAMSLVDAVGRALSSVLGLEPDPA